MDNTSRVEAGHINRTVVFILCAAHSGSTVLGHFLGSHTKAIHVGELVVPFAKKLPYACDYCGDQSCPIWHETLNESQMLAVNQSYNQSHGPWYRQQYLKKIRGKGTAQGNDLSGFVFKRLFDSDPKINIIVDSSKAPQWAEWNSNSDLYDAKYIFLVRDLRALAAGRMRRFNESIDVATKRVAKSLRYIRNYCNTKDISSVTKIRYEDLALFPEKTGRAASSFLNINFETAMIEFYKFEHHILGGNAAPTIQLRRFRGIDEQDLTATIRNGDKDYYRNQTLGFKLDNRWQDEMTTEMLKRFNAIAGELNQEAGYSE